MSKRITTDILKITAMVSMLTDHVAVAFAGFGMPAGIYWTMRCIGRLAFPIYVYFLVQGYIYTHSVGKYAIKLGLLAVISEIPYDMTVYGCFLISGIIMFYSHLYLRCLFYGRLTAFIRKTDGWCRLRRLLSFGQRH